MLRVLFAIAFAAQVQESVTVQVVEVPVYVSRHNRPVEGLTRDSFELLVDGKPQPIDYFDVVDTRLAPQQATPTADRRQRRLFLLLFDLEFSGPHQVERGRKAALELVERSSASDSFAVATFTGNRGVELRAPFGASASDVRRALRALRVTRIDHVRNRGFLSFGPIQQGPVDMAGPTGGRRGFGGEIAARRHQAPPMMKDLGGAPTSRLAELLLSDFTRVSESLVKMDGQKHVVLFSAGPPLGFDNSYSMELLLGMEKAFQHANAFLHTVDIAGLRIGSEPGASGTLHTLARGTGGMFLHNTNDFSQLMKEVDEVHRLAYVLGFTPRVAKKGHRRIEVRVRGVERAIVAYRRGVDLP